MPVSENERQEILQSWLNDSTPRFRQIAEASVRRVLDAANVQTDPDASQSEHWRQFVAATCFTAESVLAQHVRDETLRVFANASPILQDAIRKHVVGLIEENLDEILHELRTS